MRYVKIGLLFLMMLTSMSMGTEQVSSENTKELNKRGQVVLETIQTLEKSGYITSRSATEAKKEMVFDDESLYRMKQQIEKEDVVKDKSGVTYGEYISWLNLIKLLAIISFIIAFNGIIMKFMYLFTRIPSYVYQAVLLTWSLYLTFYSEMLWDSEAAYISIFAVVANLIILGWIIAEYEEFFKKLFKLIAIGLPPQIVISFYLTIYFGVFAVMLDSSLLGIFTLVSFMSIFGFMLHSTGLDTYIGYEKEAYMNASIIVNGIILFAYSYVMIHGIQVPYVDVFSVGIEYVATLAFIIALIINASPFYSDGPAFVFSFFLLIVSFVLSVTASMLWGLEVIPAIINTGFFIFLLGWIAHLSYKISGILMSFMIGLSLYGFALLAEANPELFVTALF